MTGMFPPIALIPRHKVRWRTIRGGLKAHAVRLITDDHNRMERTTVCGRQPRQYNDGLAPAGFPECLRCAELIERIGPDAA